jgi:hypothetical protein
VGNGDVTASQQVFVKNAGVGWPDPADGAPFERAAVLQPRRIPSDLPPLRAVEQSQGRTRRYNLRGVHMNLHLTIAPLVALIAGVLILVIPRLLNYIVALYLIIIGLLGLFPGAGIH